MKLRVGDSSGVDSGGSDYHSVMGYLSSDSTAITLVKSTGTSGISAHVGLGNSTGEGGGGMAYLVRPGDGTTFPNIVGTSSDTPDNPARHRAQWFSGRRTSVITLDRIQLIMPSGNITSGRLTVWGIAHE
jgi:hypothetical protein